MSTTNPSDPFEGCLGIFNSSADGRFQRQNVTSNSSRLVRPIEGVPTPNEVDRMVAKEMTRLSMKERESAENDVHGIGVSSINEDPLSLESHLLSLNAFLQGLKAGTAYEMAEQMSLDYVLDRNFRLMFIRACRYDSKEAAERMIRFFDLKRELFGKEKLVEDITLKDLSLDDMETMRSGYMQVSPYKDMAGRPIVFGILKLRKMKEVDNASRVSFYVFMSVMESLEAQQRGIVAVYYLLDATNFQSVTGKLRTTLPIQFGSIHLCYNDITQYAVTCMGVYSLPNRSKVRFRPHFGSHIECQYALTTFGIPRAAIPISTTGEMYTGEHLKWLASREMIETERNFFKVSVPPLPHGASNSIISTTSNGQIPIQDTMRPPQISWSSVNRKGAGSSETVVAGSNGSFAIRDTDVLFGRGKTVVEHPGNLDFRNLVGKRMEEYEAASRLEKTCMTETIVQMIKNKDGRFLKRDDGGGWEEVDDETARKKVAHAFRNRRKLPNGFL